MILQTAIAGLFRPQYSDHDEACLLAMAKIHRRAQVEEIARPMRALFALLATGEAMEVDGRVVMEMPRVAAVTDLDPEAEFVEVAPCLLGWIDCWHRISPKIRTQHMRYLAERIQADKAVTPRLVEQARDEFEATIATLHDVPDAVIRSAILRTKIAWEFERREAAACQ